MGFYWGGWSILVAKFGLVYASSWRFSSSTTLLLCLGQMIYGVVKKIFNFWITHGILSLLGTQPTANRAYELINYDDTLIVSFWLNCINCFSIWMDFRRSAALGFTGIISGYFGGLNIHCWILSVCSLWPALTLQSWHARAHLRARLAETQCLR